MDGITPTMGRPRSLEPVDRLNCLQKELRGLLQESLVHVAPAELAEGGLDFYEAVAEHERSLIRTALRITGGKQKEAAKLLRIGPSTLHSKIKTLGIDLREYN